MTFETLFEVGKTLAFCLINTCESSYGLCVYPGKCPWSEPGRGSNAVVFLKLLIL